MKCGSFLQFYQKTKTNKPTLYSALLFILAYISNNYLLQVIQPTVNIVVLESCNYI